MSSIEGLIAREILDSRGNPTIEVEVLTADGAWGRAAVPSGASTGKFEALEMRDGGERYSGKGVLGAVRAVEETIAPELMGVEASDQREIDRLLIDIDGTPDKSRLGANAVLGVSLAIAHAASSEAGMPLFRYLGGAGAHLLPVPMMNVINGGAHATNNLDIQEFMIVPLGAASFSEALQMGAETYHALGSILEDRGLSGDVGDEGGFAPDLAGHADALVLLEEAIEKAGYEVGSEIALAIDVAASEFFSDGAYRLEGESKTLDSSGLGELLASWLDDHPIVSIEDPLDEEDWEGWAALTSEVGEKVQLVGDDIFVTNTQRISQGIERGVANAVLIKVNQIGTITETLEAVTLASEASYASVMSHRSGETEDATIADLSVAWSTGQIKCGAPARSDRVAKYNQLLRIEEELAEGARFKGRGAFPRWHA